MDYTRRQDFNYFYGGNLRPIIYWMPFQQLPSSTAYFKRTFRYATCKFRDFKNSDLQGEFKSRAQKERDLKRRKTFFERKTVCAMTPGAELSDREFQKLFSRPAIQPELSVATDSLVCSLEFAENKIQELEKKLDQLNTSNTSAQKVHTVEMEQSKETIKILETENQSLLSENAKLSTAVANQEQKCHELSTQLDTAQKTVEHLTSYKQHYFDAEGRWSFQMDRAQALEHQVSQQAKMINDLRSYKQDYYDTEVRWSEEHDKCLALEQKVQQQAMMLDNWRRSSTWNAGGPCPHGHTDCSSSVRSRDIDTRPVEIPVLNSISPMNNAKQKQKHKGRKK